MMKIVFKISAYLAAVGLLMLAVTACSEKDEWAPGQKPDANSPGVYFDRNTPGVAEMDVDAQMNLIQDYLVITLGRDPLKSGQALTVPIKKILAAPNLTVPDAVTFAAGEETAEMQVRISNFEIGNPYQLALEIDEKFTNPYLSYAGGTNGGSTRLDLKVVVVAALGKVTFTPGDYSGGKPDFVPFKQKIYISGPNQYTIRNFLFNNAGYDFVFTVDNDNNIIPDPGSGYFEAGSGANARWYFYSAPADVSANRIPCYIPGADPAQYITYIYFYLDPTYKYFGFYLDKDNKTGKMWGYARFSAGLSSGRMSFTLSW